MHYGWEKDVTALMSQIDRLTAEELQAVAAEVFCKDKLTALTFV